MKRRVLYWISLLLSSIYAASSSPNIIPQDKTLTIPGNNCKPIPTSYKTNLSYTILQEKCKNINTKYKIKIETNFEGIDTNLFEKMTQLESLQASYLNFTTINLSSSNLKTIDLSRNKIRKFRLFLRQKLKTLDVSFNKLMTIQLTPVDEETNLEILDISHNVLQKIDDISILQNLKYLDLSWNKIETIPHKAFFKLKKMLTLNLSFNKLSSMRKCLFCSLENLKFLDISHNGIKTVDVLLVSPLRTLRILELDGEDIEDFQYLKLLEKHPELREVRTTQNSLKCGYKSSATTCFYVVRGSCCSLKKKKTIRKRSIPNSHFHATINDKKMSHNVSAIVPSKTNNDITLKDFLGKLHRLNVDNAKNYLELTLAKIDSIKSQLDQKNANVTNQINVVNSKLDELNDTLSDMVLEISNMDNGDGLSLKLDEIIPTTYGIEQDYKNILYLLRFCVFLLSIAVFLITIRIVMRMSRIRGYRKDRMDLLNLETVEHS